MAQEDRFLTQAETCTKVCLCKATIRDMIARSEFPGPIFFGAKKMFSLLEVEAWMQAQRENPERRIYPDHLNAGHEAIRKFNGN